MKREQRTQELLQAVSRFFFILLFVAFVITCCLMLFVSLLQQSMGITFSREDITDAAKATIVNIIFISIAFWGIDTVRRHFAVRRPARQIVEAAERMIEGDFTVRVAPVSRFFADDVFRELISCINRMAEELSGVESLRSDFIANVSHEMKTPLAVIQNYGSLLSDPSLAPERRIEYARGVTDACRRLSDMVTNVLRLNRLENQTIYPNPERYDLGEQLCECLLGYESVWEKRSITVDADIAEGVFVMLDRELLSLVWNNLLSNAFKFTDDGGSVGVSVLREGSLAIVRISDTGCGMTPEVGAHIFEKFYQADNSRATGGNGLGLALVKRVVDIVGGEISVESRVGVGSTFTVKIRSV